MGDPERGPGGVAQLAGCMPSYSKAGVWDEEALQGGM